MPPNIPDTPRDVERNEIRTGFTLIELLVVIAIIAILASLLFPVVRLGLFQPPRGLPESEVSAPNDLIAVGDTRYVGHMLGPIYKVQTLSVFSASPRAGS